MGADSIQFPSKASAGMYSKILVPVENSPNDQVILNHIQELVVLTQARLLLVCVAHGWVARNFDQLKLPRIRRNAPRPGVSDPSQ